MLRYTEPFNWAALLDFFRTRQVPGVEHVDSSVYRRTVSVNGSAGVLEVHADHPCSLGLEISETLRPHISSIISRVRHMFDLDADPHAISRVLERDPLLRPRLAKHPGLRVPGCWDPFELSVRAVLGQQVSVAAARTFAGRLASAAGQLLAPADSSGVFRIFPGAQDLASADLTSIGLTRARIATLRALACGADPVSGMGPWTRAYIAMRAHKDPDAFPASDLVLRRALNLSEKELLLQAERWRPWRAYAAVLLWRTSTKA